MKLLLLTAITFFAILIFPTRILAQLNLQDSSALVSLYDSTKGNEWINHTNWLTTAPVNTWYGVHVKDNRVDSLKLNFNNLDGSLPSSIGNLSALTDLELLVNKLAGNIPSTLGNLSNLTHLDLTENLLTGSIPLALGNLANIQYLHLGNNKLTGGIPTILNNLNQLQYLDLSFNQLNGAIPAVLGNLINLQSLTLNANQFTGSIPTSLGKLYNLVNLDLGYNQLTGIIPDSLKYILRLNDLELNGNLLTGGIPDFIGDLINLKYLDLSGNPLGDTIPSSIGRLSNLIDMDFEDNQLIGNIPSSLGNLQNLQALVLDHNSLSGSIPSSLGNMSGITQIFLHINQLTGKIPASFGNLTLLRDLLLDDNLLSDSIPSTLLALSNLRSLRLQNNQFTFSGMEGIVQQFSGINYLTYAPQANIKLHQNNNILSVSVGGNLANETFDWYKDGSFIKSITGDSSFTIISSGQYSVTVNNSVATQLNLSSDIVDVISLPLTWISVSAINKAKYILVNWKTAMELNNNYFSIERSSDGINFSEIGEVKSKDNFSQMQQYSFQDFNFISDQNYYRIKQVDKDGKFSYSKIVKIESVISLSISPNPAINVLTIKGLGNNNSVLHIVDANGKIVNSIQTANDVSNWNIQNLAAGNYFLVVSQNNKIVASLKFIKQ